MTLVIEEGAEGKLRFNWAGNTCTGWSTIRNLKQKRFAHSSERTNNVWIAHRVRFGELDEEDV